MNIRKEILGRTMMALLMAATCQTTLAQDAKAGSAKLDDIEVTASGGASRVNSTWRSVSKSSIVDMKDVLTYQPGVSVASGNGQAQQLYIRDVGENHLTFTVDGAGVRSQDFHHQSRFMFDPSFLKRIHIQKGSGAASAGIGVTSGAIRMETVDAMDLLDEGRKWGLKLNGGWRSNKGYEGGAGVYGVAGPFDGIVIVNRVHQGKYKDGKGRVVDLSATDQTGAMIKLGWSPNDHHRLSFTQRYESDKGVRPFRLNLSKLRRLPPTESWMEQHTSNLQYKARNLDGFLDTVDANAFWAMRRDRKTATEKTEPDKPLRKSDTGVTTFGANLGLSSQFYKSHRLNYGLNAMVENAHAKDYQAGRGREDKQDYGAYAEAIVDWHPVTLTAGLRYDWWSVENTGGQKRTGSDFNPSLAALWEVSPEFSLRASIAQASRSPKINESYMIRLDWSADSQMAKDLKAERSITGELGFDWKRGGFNLSGAIFNQHVHDYVEWDWVETGEDEGYDLLKNIGKMTNKGYELDASYSRAGFTAGLGVDHSFPQLEDKYYHSALEMMPSGRHWNASLSYKFQRPSLEIGWRGRLAEEYKWMDPDPDPEDVGKVGIVKGYTVHDLFINWQPLGKDTWNVNLTIRNLTNELYHGQNSMRWIGIEDDDVPPEKGRDIRLSMNYRF